MRIDVTPRRYDIVPGVPIVLTLTITNTTQVIGGYNVRVLGADPGWVAMDVEQVSLFPDEVRVVPLTVTPPKGLPAGLRRIAVQVRELTPPQESSIVDVDLVVPAARGLSVRADPVAVTAGRRAGFSVVAENTGNTVIEGRFAADDPESRVAFAFDPEIVHLAPGEHAVVDMRAAARRHLAGAPTVRPLGIYLDELPADAFFSDPDAAIAGKRGEENAVAAATFIQKPVLSRGAFSLAGLLIAVTVFAFVITLALGKLVGQSTADRNLALQVAAARNAGTSSGTSGLAGTVKLLTDGTPLSAVSVSVFDSGDTIKPLVTTATDAKGTYTVAQLAAGKYKLSFKRAGFVTLWFPAATDDADATTVEVKAGEQKQGLDIAMGGVPASITGTVSGDDVSASTLYLETVPGRANTGGTGTNTSSTAPLPGAPSAAPAAPDAGAAAPNPLSGGAAIVQKVPVGADGTFTLTNVPSPNVYDLVVVKPGYATTIQELDVAGGEQRTSVQLALRKGDGLISGTVSDAVGPLKNVTITATSGTTSLTTVSLSQPGQVGQFTLRGLPTPGSFTLTATSPGHAAQTLSLTLASGQKLTGVSVTLATSAGSLEGTVYSLPKNTPATGVTVTATDGLLTVQTQTQSTGHAGHWVISGLPVPGTYTVTFTRSDLTSQTVSASLDAGGATIGGPVKVFMQQSTTTLRGTILERCAPAPCTPGKIGEATVTLNAGAQTYSVVSAGAPAADTGKYVIANIPPGTYTLTVSTSSGVSSSSQVVTLKAGATPPHDVTLDLPASVEGTLVSVDKSGNVTGTLQGWTVFLYTSAQYPTIVTTTATSDATGHFSFPEVEAGDYLIAVGRTNDPATTVMTQPFTVQPSDQKDLRQVRVPQ